MLVEAFTPKASKAKPPTNNVGVDSGEPQPAPVPSAQQPQRRARPAGTYSPEDLDEDRLQRLAEQALYNSTLSGGLPTGQ